ncbi:hypothetical protein SAMN06265360_1581, partial [Haloechinothrix alba]
MLRWLKTVVVSDEEKASVEASGGDQEDERKRTAVDVSKHLVLQSHLLRSLSCGVVASSGALLVSAAPFRAGE